MLTWNPNFNGFNLKSTFFKDTCCERSTFCWILKEITVFAVTCWRDNKYRFFAYVIFRKGSKLSKKTYRTLFNAPKQNCMQNLERFRQSSLLRKTPNALFPPNPSYVFDIRHPYVLLTAVISKYLLTSITWSYSGLSFRAHQGCLFFEVDCWPSAGFRLDHRLMSG